MRIELTRAIGAPSGLVWAVITDLPNSPQAIMGIESVEMLGGPETFDVGTRWRVGKVATEEREVSAVTPGASCSVLSGSHGMRYESVFTLHPTGEAVCRLTGAFSREPTTAASRAMAATVGRLFQGQTRKALEKDLADISAAAEARSV